MQIQAYSIIEYFLVVMVPHVSPRLHLQDTSMESIAVPATSTVPAAVAEVEVAGAESPIGSAGNAGHTNKTPRDCTSWGAYLVYGVQSDASASTGTSSNSAEVGKQPKYYQKSEAGMVTFRCPGCQVW